MIKEYNDLTKKLLAEGYTIDNHPGNVKVGNGCFDRDNPLDNFYGGFEYERKWIWAQTFETPCGCLCKGTSGHTGMAYMGIEWNFEYNHATICCPYRKRDCPLRHKFLAESGNIYIELECVIHFTDRIYEYEGSLEELKKQSEQRMYQKKHDFLEQHERACPNHMYYNQDTEQWTMRYDAMVCVNTKCRGYCPVLGRQLDKKRGNVYYDIKTEGHDYSKDGTLFEGERFCKITKGVRAFKCPVSMDICKIFVERYQDKIIDMAKGKHDISTMLFYKTIQNLDINIEVINIRAKQKDSRDLEQDLRDLSEGIKIEFAEVVEANKAEAKRNAKEQRKQKKIEALETKYIKCGYSGLDTREQIQFEKLIDAERWTELDEIRQKSKTEAKKEPEFEQMSLFDLGMQ